MEKVWLKNYQKGVPAEIDLSQYQSLVDYAEECFEKFREKVSYTNMGKSITYGELDELSKAFANYLTHDLNLKKGDRVAIMLPNLMQYPVAMFGIHRAGMVVVNVNPLYKSHELQDILVNSGTTTILVLANFANTVQMALPGTQVKHILTTEIGDMLGFLKGTLVNFVVKRIKKMVPAYDLPSAVSFRKAIALGRKKRYVKPELTQKDIAYLQYTGGTTGVAKGAILTHKNMVANVLQTTSWIQPMLAEMQPKGGIITALPLYHIFSLMSNCPTFLSVGIPNILITNPRDIPGFVKELKRQPFAVMTGVNTLFNALLHNKEFCELDFSNFQFTLGGGMAVQKAVAQRWKEVTGCGLIEAYGLTEASPAVTINPVNTKDYNGSIGLPLPSTDVVILNDEGKEVDLGQPGELCVKGPQVMEGYWQDPILTQGAFTPDGWLKTGDMACMDENGYVKIVDRKKDMITVSGFKVYPNEVEDLIASIAGVKEVAIVGVPDLDHGERVRAYIVKSDDLLTKEQVILRCKERLTNYKVPKEIIFRTELPKTNVGKVLRRALRDEALVEIEG